MKLGWAMLALGATALLAGCDQSNHPPPPTPPAAAEIGRWTVVPAANAPERGALEIFSAWRLDTKTGDLEFCTYGAGTFAPGTKPGELLQCTDAVAVRAK